MGEATENPLVLGRPQTNAGAQCRTEIPGHAIQTQHPYGGGGGQAGKEVPVQSCSVEGGNRTHPRSRQESEAGGGFCRLPERAPRYDRMRKIRLSADLEL